VKKIHLGQINLTISPFSRRLTMKNSILHFLRRNFLELMLTGVSVVWIGILIFSMFFTSRDVTFFDVISQTNVNSEYNSELTIMRYLFDPISGLVFGLGSNGMNWIGESYVILYLIVRILIGVINRGVYHDRLLQHPFVKITLDALEFMTKFTILIFIGIVSVLGIGYLLVGFIFIGTGFRIMVNIAVWLSIGLFILKFVLNEYQFKKSECTEFSFRFRKHYTSRIDNWGKDLRGARKKVFEFFAVFHREIKLILSITVLIMMANNALTTLVLPTQHIATDLQADEMLLDFHLHSSASDGSLSPAQKVQWYMEQGISGAAFTDHHSPNGYIQAQQYVDLFHLNFSVYVAQEYSSYDPDIHLNIYGITEIITPIEFKNDPYAPNCYNVSDMIQFVKDNKGFVTVNHYGGQDGDPFTLEQLRDWGVDGFEVANMGRDQGADIRQFCIDNNLIMIGGSDEHHNKELNTFIRLTLEDPTNRSLDGIFASLRHNTHEAVILQYDTRKVEIENEIINDLFNYLLNITPLQTFSWIFWSIGTYVIVIVVLRNQKHVRFKVEPSITRE
jgi:hypothetical protein